MDSAPPALGLVAGSLSAPVLIESSRKLYDVLRSEGLRPLLDLLSDGQARRIEPEVFLEMMSVLSDSEEVGPALAEQYGIAAVDSEEEERVTVDARLFDPVKDKSIKLAPARCMAWRSPRRGGPAVGSREPEPESAAPEPALHVEAGADHSEPPPRSPDTVLEIRCSNKHTLNKLGGVAFIIRSTALGKLGLAGATAEQVRSQTPIRDTCDRSPVLQHCRTLVTAL